MRRLHMFQGQKYGFLAPYNMEPCNGAVNCKHVIESQWIPLSERLRPPATPDSGLRAPAKKCWYGPLQLRRS